MSVVETLPPLRSLRVTWLLLIPALLISSCTTGAPQATPQVVSVYSSFAAEPWVRELYECAAQDTNSLLSRVGDPSAADIVLRIGEPAFLSSFAYQIDAEEILIVTHRQSPVQNLTLGEARTLFMQTDPSLQVWVYASGEDIQRVFDQFVMEGRNVTPSAFVAVSPQQMFDTVVNQSNAIGILPRNWKAGDLRGVYSIATVPVLATTRNEPVGAIGLLIDCLQK